MSLISTQELQSKIEEQKQNALIGTRHIFVHSPEVRPVQAAVNTFSSLTQNPSLFEIHQFNGSQNPGRLAREIASACPRLLVVAVCDTRDSATRNWLQNSFPQYVSQLPFADCFYVDAGNLTNIEKTYYESLGVVNNPTVLVFKIGHLIDSFNISLESVKPNILEQLADRDARIRADLARKPAPVNVDDILRRGTDTGRDAYEQREREKAAQAARLEAIRKREERMRVKERIEAQRKARK